MSEQSSTYCHYPFHELALKSFYKGKAYAFWPCCMMGNKLPGDTITSSRDRMYVDEPWNLNPEQMFYHPRMELLRERMLKGERDPACKVCWSLEDAGIKSYRHSSKSYFHSSEPVSFDVIDLTIGNICNLRCRMCVPSSSNLLMTDNKYFENNNLLERVEKATGGWYPSRATSAETSLQVDWLINNPGKVKVIKATGGETFYDAKIVELIKTYIKNGAAKDVILQFITNGTMFDEELVDLLNQFKANGHTISVDGTGKVYNYIRHLSDFDVLTEKIKFYIDNIKNQAGLFQFACVVSAHNVLNLNDYINWVHSMTDKSWIVFSPINPSNRGVALQHMPVNLLLLAKERLSKFSSDITGSVISQIDFAIRENKENKNAILEETELFDMARNQSYKDFLDPALVEYLST